MNKIIIILWGVAVLVTIPYLFNEAESFQSHTARLYCVYMEHGLLDKYLDSLPRSIDIFTLSGSNTMNVCGKLITNPEVIATIEMIEQIHQSNCDWHNLLYRFSSYCWNYPEDLDIFD